MRIALASDDDLANLQMTTIEEHFNFGEPAEIDLCLDLPDQIRAIVLAQNLTCNNARHLFGRTLNKNEVISTKIKRVFDIPREHIRTFALSLGTARYLDFSYFSKAGNDGFTDAVITHLQDKINELKDEEKNRFENITIQLLAGCAAFEDRKCKTRKTLANFFLREAPKNFCKEAVMRLCSVNFKHWPKKVEESMSEAQKTIKKKWA